VIRTNAGLAVPAGAAATQRRNLIYVGDVPEIARNGVTVNTLPSVVGPYGQRGDSLRGALTLAWDVGPATITSVTAYDKRNTNYIFDGDNTVCDAATVAAAAAGNPGTAGCPNFGFPFAPGSTIALGSSQFALSANKGSFRDFSQELRVSTNGEGPVSLLLGAFYYNNKANSIDISIAPVTQAALNAYGRPNQISTTKSKAVFGSVIFRPTERFSVTGELRYEQEDQTFRQAPTNPCFIPVAAGGSSCPGITPGTPTSPTNPAPIAVPASARLFDLKTDFDFVTPRVIVDFKPVDDMLIYASVARGVKTGGINTNLSIFDNQRFYQPEKSWNYEVGLKSDLLDRRLRLNLAAYYTDWEDQQVACQNPVNLIAGSSTQRTYVCNVGQAEIYGLEAQATARIAEYFTLSANYAYTHARYKAFVDDSLAAALAQAGLPAINFNGKRLPYVPDHKFTVSPQFNLPLTADYELQLRGDVTHQSRSYVRADNLQSFAPKTLVDLRVSVGNERFGVQAFVNNLFDDATPVAAVRFFDSVNYSVASPLVTGADRRQFGVTVRAGF
jgi:iron complex outermembrane receptor protein